MKIHLILGALLLAGTALTLPDHAAGRAAGRNAAVLAESNGPSMGGHDTAQVAESSQPSPGTNDGALA